jgi:hypothetical protein
MRLEVAWGDEARAPARDDVVEVSGRWTETEVRGVVGQICKFVRAALGERDHVPDTQTGRLTPRGGVALPQRGDFIQPGVATLGGYPGFVFDVRQS